MGMEPERKEGKCCWELNEVAPTLIRVHTIGELEHSSWHEGPMQNRMVPLSSTWKASGCSDWDAHPEALQNLPKVCAQVYGSWNGNKQNENKAT